MVVGVAASSACMMTGAMRLSCMPGPGGGWRALAAGLATADIKRLDVLLEQMRRQYGPIFQFKHPLRDMNTVVTFRPCDAQKMFSSEGCQPIRPGFFPMKAYKTQQGMHQGLFSSNGSEWEIQRRSVQQYMLSMSRVHHFLPHVTASASWLVQQIDDNRLPDGSSRHCFTRLAYAAAFHVICKVSLGSDATIEDHLLPDIQHNARELFDCMSALEMKVNLWRYLPTPRWRQFCKYMNVYDRLVKRWCSTSLRSSGISASSDSLVYELSRRGVDQAALHAMLFDFLFGGFDTTGNALSFLLYRLATNERCQQRLLDEINSVNFDADTCIDTNKLPYLRACIKESFRMNHPVFAVARQLYNDTHLSGYLVPKGTVVMVPTSMVARMETEHEMSDAFLPERWMRESPVTPAHAFSSLPFSHGRRMCVGRRLVELELMVFVLKILKKYRLEYEGQELQTTHQLICQPKSEIRLRFISR